MAIDPRISLTPAPTINVGQRFGQALQNVQSLDNLQQNRRLAPLKEQQAQMNVDYQSQVQPMQVAAMQRQQAEANDPLNIEVQRIQQLQAIGADYAQGLNQALATGNADNVQQYIQSKAQQYRDLPEVAQGITQDLQQLLTPTGMQELQAEVNAMAQGGKSQLAIKSSAPIVNQSTGQLETPFFNQSTGEAGVIPIEGAYQETATEIAKREFEAKQKEADLDIATTKRKETIKKTVARTSALKAEFSERRKLAARSTRKVKEAQKLAEKATQGLIGASKVQLGRVFPNIDTSNETALSGAFKSLALDELQKFSGPTTDFEFSVTEDIAGSLGDGAFANKARLASLERNNWFMNRESEQFNNHIKAGHDPDEFNFNINELVTPKKGGKSYTLQSLQDTAVANHISIDEVIKRLSK